MATQAKKNKEIPGVHFNTLRKRVLMGQTVIPVKYFGKNVGYGNYLAGGVVDAANKLKLICDESGKPLNFRKIGELV